MPAPDDRGDTNVFSKKEQVARTARYRRLKAEMVDNAPPPIPTSHVDEMQANGRARVANMERTQITHSDYRGE